MDRFQKTRKPFDGVLFVTLEYNRSTPAVINAIDGLPPRKKVYGMASLVLYFASPAQ